MRKLLLYCVGILLITSVTEQTLLCMQMQMREQPDFEERTVNLWLPSAVNIIVHNVASLCFSYVKNPNNWWKIHRFDVVSAGITSSFIRVAVILTCFAFMMKAYNGYDRDNHRVDWRERLDFHLVDHPWLNQTGFSILTLLAYRGILV